MDAAVQTDYRQLGDRGLRRLLLDVIFTGAGRPPTVGH